MINSDHAHRLRSALCVLIVLILAGAALPIARRNIRYQQEAELPALFAEMKDSIDRYKDAADKNLIRVEVGSEGYPPDLETLVTA